MGKDTLIEIHGGVHIEACTVYLCSQDFKGSDKPHMGSESHDNGGKACCGECRSAGDEEVSCVADSETDIKRPKPEDYSYWVNFGHFPEGSPESSEPTTEECPTDEDSIPSESISDESDTFSSSESSSDDGSTCVFLTGFGDSDYPKLKYGYHEYNDPDEGWYDEYSEYEDYAECPSVQSWWMDALERINQDLSDTGEGD